MAPTPSSLHWLITQYQRIKGEKLRQLRQLERYTSDRWREPVVQLLDGQLAQLRAVIALHEVQIDPDDLQPVQPHHRPPLLGHCGMTRLIYATLSKAKNQTATTADIVAAVIQALPEPPVGDEINRIRARVSVRLSIMAERGRLIKHSSPFGRRPPQWSPALYPPSRSPDAPDV